MDKKLTTLLKSQAYIDGVWTGAPGYAVTDKATGEVITRVPDMGAEDARRAIAAADAAFKTWSKTLAKERAIILRRFYELILDHADELALLLTREQGKPLSEAKGEVTYGAGFVEFNAEQAKRIYGEMIPAHRAGTRVMVT